MAQLLNNSRVYGKLTVDTTLTINGGNTSTNTTSGSMVIAGGLGVSENVFAGAIHSDNYFYSDGTPLLLEISNQIDATTLHTNAAFDLANTLSSGTALDGWARQVANSASSYANSAYLQANTATTDAATADQKAVTSGSYANSAYAQANIGIQYAQSSGDYANSAFIAANNVILYTDNAIANLVNSAPVTLDTLNELANALGNDENFATTVSTNIGIIGLYANAAYDQANTANTQAWIAYGEALNANTFVRQRADAAGSYANSAFIQANSAIVLAQAAYDQANTGNTTGGSDLTTILATLYSPPTGDYGQIIESDYSAFGEFITVTYDLKTTFPEGNGLLEIDWGVV